MNWHYEKAGQGLGPVTDEEMLPLRTENEIGPDTRVWTEGWPDWRRAGDVWPAFGGANPPPVPSGYAVTPRCAECGKNCSASELLPVGKVFVCETCKPLAVQKLQEGALLGGGAFHEGPWRDGKQLVVQKGVPLPPRCIKCGEQSGKELKRKLQWHHPLIYLTLLPSVLIYIIVALIVRRNITISLPLCLTCNGKRKWNIAIGWLSFFAGVAFMIMGISMSNRSDLNVWYVLAPGFVFLLFSLIWAMASQVVLPKKIDDTHAWISKVKAPFLDALPQWPGR